MIAATCFPLSFSQHGFFSKPERINKVIDENILIDPSTNYNKGFLYEQDGYAYYSPAIGAERMAGGLALMFVLTLIPLLIIGIPIWAGSFMCNSQLLISLHKRFVMPRDTSLKEYILFLQKYPWDPKHYTEAEITGLKQRYPFIDKQADTIAGISFCSSLPIYLYLYNFYNPFTISLTRKLHAIPFSAQIADVFTLYAMGTVIVIVVVGVVKICLEWPEIRDSCRPY